MSNEQIGVPGVHRCSALAHSQINVAAPVRIERDTINTPGDNKWYQLTTSSDGAIVTTCPYCHTVLPTPTTQ